MKNRFIGSVLIVAGTTIGAGMLAMPLASAGIGFTATLIMMLGLWALTCYSALMLLEVHQHAAPDAGLGSLAEQCFGTAGRWIASSSMAFLMYALIAAYITGGGGQLSNNLKLWLHWDFSPLQGTLLFTALLGGAVCISTRAVDALNRVLFTVKVIALILMLFLMLPHVEGTNLLAMPLEQGLILSAIPVIFTSFGFHGSIPSLVRYLNGDTKKLKFVLILGSAIPLFAYILWQLATHGAISQAQMTAILAENPSLAGLMHAVDNVVANPKVDAAVRIFADMALATSFLGVTLGMFDFLADAFRRSDNASGRLQTGLITFIPPLIFALFYPQGFVMALGYAAIALAILALLLPAAMVWKMRRHSSDTSPRRGLKPNRQIYTYGLNSYKVSGGIIGIFVVFASGIAIIAIQIAGSFGLLPGVVG